jgi:hypothetical protein
MLSDTACSLEAAVAEGARHALLGELSRPTILEILRGLSSVMLRVKVLWNSLSQYTFQTENT